MDIRDLRKHPHLSASGINSYVECGLQYKFSRIDGLAPEFRPDAMELGSCIHRALADFNQERMMGVIPPLKELQACFERHWKKAAENNPFIQYKTGSDYKSHLRQGKSLLKAYHENLPAGSFNILAIEEPFRFMPKGMDIPVIGVMDLVEEDESGTIIIADYKTAARAYSVDDVDKNFQLNIYHMAAKANGFGHREILLRFDCLIKTRSPRFEQYYTTRSSSDEQRATRKIKAVWNAIQQGIFIPNDTSWKCRTCTYKTHCDAWFEGG